MDPVLAIILWITLAIIVVLIVIARLYFLFVRYLFKQFREDSRELFSDLRRF